MNAAERSLLQQLNNNVDSFDQYFEPDSADAPPVTTRPSGAKLAAVKGNPAFSAQFDISFALRFFTVVTATGVYTNIAAAALNAALKNQLPAYVFGNSDFATGFTNVRRTFPLNTWVHERPGIYGKDFWADGAGTVPAFDATVKAFLANGDLVIPFSSALPGAGTTTVGLVIVRCTQVPYGTLLAALASDRFVMNMIRYVIPDTTKIGQYNNNIGLFKQSLFGKFDSDFLSPNSYKKPEQQQNGLIDIPLKKGIDKQIVLGTYINFDCIDMSWSIFVWTVNKVTA
jgi:hypothetical protein